MISKNLTSYILTGVFMQNRNATVIKAAFKLGFITSILENELNDLDADSPLQSYPEIVEDYFQTLLLFENDYKEIFKEGFILLSSFRSAEEKNEFLLAKISLTRDRINSLNQSEIELAFFTGATLAVSYEEEREIFSVMLYTEILELIFKWCEEETYQLEESVSKVLSEDVYECIIGRNEIFYDLIGDEITPDQKSAFNLLDKVVVKKI